MLNGVLRTVTTFSAAVALCTAPALASASVAAAPTQSINPMIALSIFGSQASAAALCGASATTVTASAAATAQAPTGGCVLPLVDAPPPPVPAAEAAPFVPAPIAATGFGIAPVLLGLAGIAVLSALILSQKDRNDDGDEEPVSLN